MAGEKRPRSSSKDKTSVDEITKDDEAAHPCLEFLAAGPRAFSVVESETRGTTLVANRDLPPHSLLVRLPTKFLVTYEAVCATALSKVIGEVVSTTSEDDDDSTSTSTIIMSPEELTWLNMVYWLASSEMTSHQVYLKSLSKVPPNLSAWSQSLRDELIGSNVYAVLDESGNGDNVDGNVRVVHTLLVKLDRIRNVLKENTTMTEDSVVCGILLEASESSIFTTTSISWARGHFLSRRFPALLDKFRNTTVETTNHLAGYGNATSMFVPVLDLMNHTPVKANACTIEITPDYLQVSTGDTDLAKGDELFYCYAEGGQSNEVLLQGYGFCLPNNPADTVSVKICGTSETPAFFSIGRGGANAIPNEMWRAMAGMSTLPTEDENIEIGSGDLELLVQYMTTKLTQLLNNSSSKTSNNTTTDESNTDKERLSFIEMYKSGQREILEALIQDLSSMLEG